MIQADYLNANAKQLQSLYEYQRAILNAFTEVVNRVSKVQNYSQSIEIKKQQLASLESAVDVANKLFQNARVEYLDVLTALRDRNEARIVLIETKQEQLSAIINAYQALGGGWRYVGGPMQMLFDGSQPAAEQVPANQVPPGPPAEQLPLPPPLPGPVIQGPVPPPAPVFPDPMPSAADKKRPYRIPPVS